MDWGRSGRQQKQRARRLHIGIGELLGVLGRRGIAVGWCCIVIERCAQERCETFSETTILASYGWVNISHAQAPPCTVACKQTRPDCVGHNQKCFVRGSAIR